jgi:endonuclease/exonuclease/phosphatase family metal-dependent hydrolase
LTAVSVMSFSIAIGGDGVDLRKVADAIEATGADVVGIQEACGNLPAVATMLGWPNYDEPRQILSRYPLAATEGDTAFVLVEPERAFAVANVHLPANPYGPYVLRDGASIDEVEAMERTTRLADLERRIPAWTSIMGLPMPLIVTGDFNAPSHVDWGSDKGEPSLSNTTAATSTVRSEIVSNATHRVWRRRGPLCSGGLRTAPRPL